MTTLVAVILMAAIVLYGVFGGADFGTGLWDLTAGGATRGARPRALIDHAIGTGVGGQPHLADLLPGDSVERIPDRFLGDHDNPVHPARRRRVRHRAARFRVRLPKVMMRTAAQRVAGVLFATSSVLTPSCFGAVAGGIASGRVPTAGHGDPVTSWLNPTSILGGVLAVAHLRLPRGAVPRRRGRARQCPRPGALVAPSRCRCRARRRHGGLGRSVRPGF